MDLDVNVAAAISLTLLSILLLIIIVSPSKDDTRFNHESISSLRVSPLLAVLVHIIAFLSDLEERRLVRIIFITFKYYDDIEILILLLVSA